MNIFIAGISYNLSNADLGELFEEVEYYSDEGMRCFLKNV